MHTALNMAPINIQRPIDFDQTLVVYQSQLHGNAHIFVSMCSSCLQTLTNVGGTCDTHRSQGQGQQVRVRVG